MSDKVLHVNQADFAAQVLESDKPVLVDFWATWCGPCTAIAPLLDELAESRDNVRVAKVDIDKDGDIAAKYGVRAIPTLMLFANGEVKATKVGAASLKDITSLVDDHA